jgi:hypothetical protein
MVFKLFLEINNRQILLCTIFIENDYVVILNNNICIIPTKNQKEGRKTVTLKCVEIETNYNTNYHVLHKDKILSNLKKYNPK